MKEDAIKIDFRGINKFYREKIKQEFFHPFKEDLTSLPFDKISMRVAFRGGCGVSSIFDNFDT